MNIITTVTYPGLSPRFSWPFSLSLPKTFPVFSGLPYSPCIWWSDCFLLLSSCILFSNTSNCPPRNRFEASTTANVSPAIVLFDLTGLWAAVRPLRWPSLPWPWLLSSTMPWSLWSAKTLTRNLCVFLVPKSVEIHTFMIVIVKLPISFGVVRNLCLPV